MKYRRRKFKPFTNFMIDWVLTPLIVLLFVVYGVDGLLHLTDPTGAGKYSDDAYTAASYYKPDPRGYSLPPGVWQFRDWTATASENRTRYTPANNSGAQTTLTIIGDSVAFGWAVNDNETFANHIAAHCPDLNVVNTGVSGYNIDFLLKSFEVYPGDFYLWLAVNNDPERSDVVIHPTREYMPYIGVYLRAALKPSRQVISDSDWTAYIEKVRGALGAYPVLLVTFDNEFGLRLKQNVPATEVIPMYTHIISNADAHPDAVGHEQIAAGILPLLSDYGCEAMTEE